MSIEAGMPVTDTRPRSEPAVEWRVHLARRQPLRVAMVALAAVVVAVAAMQTPGGSGAALAGVALIVASAGEFLFPIRYRLTEKGAESKNPFGWRQIDWGDVKRVYVGPGSVKLSPLRHGGPREAYRGVTLRAGDDMPLERLRELVRTYRATGTEVDETA